MDDGSIVNDELFLQVPNIKRGVINVLDFFLSFIKVYDKSKACNINSLMFDPRYKSLNMVSSFVEKEQGVGLVEEYDRKSLYPMLVKCHEHLHPLVRLITNSADQNIFFKIVVWIYLSRL
jgi:hypothetical protein